jgi:hypothetical protein
MFMDASEIKKYLNRNTYTVLVIEAVLFFVPFVLEAIFSKFGDVMYFYMGWFIVSSVVNLFLIINQVVNKPPYFIWTISLLLFVPLSVILLFILMVASMGC